MCLAGCSQGPHAQRVAPCPGRGRASLLQVCPNPQLENAAKKKRERAAVTRKDDRTEARAPPNFPRSQKDPDPPEKDFTAL